MFIVSYDFKAARRHLTQLIVMFRQMKREFEDDDTWSWWLTRQIEELNQEITCAHHSVNEKMTTVTSSGHPVLHFNNVIKPIVTHWRKNEQEGFLN